MCVSADGAGRVYVFSYSNSVWSQTAELSNIVAGSGSAFGDFIAVCDNQAYVGAQNYLNGQGAVFIFANDPVQPTSPPTNLYTNIWVQTYNVQPTPFGTDDYFGNSLAMSANLAVVGSNGASMYTRVRPPLLQSWQIYSDLIVISSSPFLF